jgi:hypothetical protein
MRDGVVILGGTEQYGAALQSLVSSRFLLFAYFAFDSQKKTELTRCSFQKVQAASAIQTSIYFLPNILLGIALNACTGLLVHRVRADHLVLLTSAISAGFPLLMAIIGYEWSRWWCAFWAVLLGPLFADGELSDPCPLAFLSSELIMRSHQLFSLLQTS